MRPFYPIILLVFSNIFMTFAWYGHLKYKSTALWIVILVSWGIAFFEYCLQVPANRIGHDYYSAPQLKIIISSNTKIGRLLIFTLSYAQYRRNLLHRHLYKTLPCAGFCRICGGYKILQKKPGQSHFLKTKKAANKINKKPTISFHFSPSLR